MFNRSKIEAQKTVLSLAKPNLVWIDSIEKMKGKNDLFHCAFIHRMTWLWCFKDDDSTSLLSSSWEIKRDQND